MTDKLIFRRLVRWKYVRKICKKCPKLRYQRKTKEWGMHRVSCTAYSCSKVPQMPVGKPKYLKRKPLEHHTCPLDGYIICMWERHWKAHTDPIAKHRRRKCPRCGYWFDFYEWKRHIQLDLCPGKPL